MIATRILHVLSQRPGRTGSGVTLDALVRHASARGYAQAVVVGVPADEDPVLVGGLGAAHVHPLRFSTNALPFALPGMSDVMPYESSRFSALDAVELDAYRGAWTSHLRDVIDRVRPDVIHAHHLWLVASLIPHVAPGIPLVIHSHATGLRQMARRPHLADEVRAGVARADRVLALGHAHARDIVRTAGVPADRVSVVGAGYRDELFHLDADVGRCDEDVIYVGKISDAKGLPWLLDALELVRRDRPGVRLHVAGSGAGDETDRLMARMDGMGEAVVRHGHVSQEVLAALMRRVGVFVLPSFYEGLPLVVVEAVASGCQSVVTDLPVVAEELSPVLGEALVRVPLPRLRGRDEPVAEDLPAFVGNLRRGLDEAITRQSTNRAVCDLRPFTWGAVFDRVEGIWASVRSEGADLEGDAADR